MKILGSRSRKISPESPGGIMEKSVRTEKLMLSLKRLKKTWRSFAKNRLGLAGMILLLVFVFMAVLAEPLYDLGLIQNPNHVI